MARETANARLDIPEARERFAKNLREAIAHQGVTSGHERWLSDKIDVRWQTVQDWLQAKRFPLGHQLVQIGDAVGVDPSVLLGPLLDEVTPRWPAWVAFKETPEGASMTTLEAWAMRFFPWMRPPTVGDYRQLLALYRTNAERQ